MLNHKVFVSDEYIMNIAFIICKVLWGLGFKIT